MKEEYKDFVGIYDESVPIDLCEEFVNNYEEAKKNRTIKDLTKENIETFENSECAPRRNIGNDKVLVGCEAEFAVENTGDFPKALAEWLFRCVLEAAILYKEAEVPLAVVSL